MSASRAITFSQDRSGAVAVLAALCMFAMLALVGAAVDGARWSTAVSRHAEAVDAALIAGARVMQLEDASQEAAILAAQRMYQANLQSARFPNGGDPTFRLSEDGSAIEYAGDVRLDTMLMKVVGLDSVPVSTPARAAFARSANGGKNVELVMVLDVSGSMCDDGSGPCSSGTKFDALKSAATDLTNITFDTATGAYTTRVGVVPFARAVRVAQNGAGASIMATLTGLPATSSWTYEQCTAQEDNIVDGEIVTAGACTASETMEATDYQIIPCVTERVDGFGEFDISDDPPGPGAWLFGQAGSHSLENHWNYNHNGSCETWGTNEILPLTDRRDDVIDRLAGLQAFGPTAGALGIMAGRYVLSPNWGSVWSGNHVPAPYADLEVKQENGEPLLEKIAVVMSDGSFNTYRGWQDRTPEEVSTDAIRACDAMKADGIRIYTVAYDLDNLEEDEAQLAKSTLQACGKDLSHFYEARDEDELKAAFRDIGVKTTPLRLVQ